MSDDPTPPAICSFAHVVTQVYHLSWFFLKCSATSSLWLLPFRNLRASLGDSSPTQEPSDSSSFSGGTPPRPFPGGPLPHRSHLGRVPLPLHTRSSPSPTRASCSDSTYPGLTRSGGPTSFYVHLARDSRRPPVSACKQSPQCTIASVKILSQDSRVLPHLNFISLPPSTHLSTLQERRQSRTHYYRTRFHEGSFSSSPPFPKL